MQHYYPLTKKKPLAQRIGTSIGLFLITVGEVWFFAWIFNPHLSTGTVNFVAVVVAMLDLHLYNLTGRE